MVTVAGENAKLKSLQESAKRGGADRLKNLLIEAAQLEDIPKIRKKFEADLKSVDAQLGSVQAGKFQNVGQARQNVDSCGEHTEKLSSDFQELRTALNDSQSLLNAYPKIRAASAARHNLQATLEHVYHFADVPVRIDRIRSMLAGDDLLLKDVWKETHRLLLWKQSAKSQLCGWWKGAAVEASGSSSSDASSSPPSSSQESRETMIGKYLEDKFSMIETFVKDLEAHLLLRVRSAIDIAFKDPAKLVQAVEVIEAIEYFQQSQRRDVELWAVNRGLDVAQVVASLGHASMRQNSMDALNKEIEARASEIFSLSFVEATTKAADSGLGMTKATLDVANAMRNDLDMVLEEVAPCFPPSYDVVPKCRVVYEELIVPQVRQLYDEQHIRDLEAGDILMLIEWLQEYNAHMGEIDAGGLEWEEVERGSSILITSYKERTEAQMDTWFQNIATTDKPQQVGNDGQIFTSMPEMLFQVVYMQAGVVKGRLEGKHLQAVLMSISSKLSAEQARQIQMLHDTTREALCGANAGGGGGGGGGEDEGIDIERIVMEVNDYARLAEKCDEYATEVVDVLLQQQHIEDAEHNVLREALEDLLSDYTSHAVAAALYIPTCILTTDLHVDYLANLFTPEWESGNIVIGTCTDYLEDLKRWIVDHYFAKVVRELFDQIMARYVEGMLLHAHTRGAPFLDNTIASSNIESDANEIVRFFRGYASDLEKTGIRAPLTSVQKQVEILYWIAKILSKPNLEELLIEDATMRLVEYFEDRGVAVATLIAKLHPSGPRNEKTEKETSDRLTASHTAWNASRRGAVQTAAKGLKGAVHVGAARFGLDFVDLHADTVTKHEMGPERFLSPRSLRGR
jgi:hypothetical protein